jgi:hypothetical protein
MSRFLTELEVELINDDTIWRLKQPLMYYSDLLECTLVVPAGFETDFASVPRVPVAYYLFGSRAHRESVIHDYLFRKDSKPVVDFMTANTVFLEAMELRGKTKFVRYAMFLGVCFSFFAYHKKFVRDLIV